jgi:hypothetical protein
MEMNRSLTSSCARRHYRALLRDAPLMYRLAMQIHPDDAFKQRAQKSFLRHSDLCEARVSVNCWEGSALGDNAVLWRKCR